MPLVMLVGLVLTIIVWTQVSWVWGLVAGLLLLGGLGWRILASIRGFIVGRRNPGTHEFIAAWESRVGEMQFGQPGTYPPPGAYQAWREAHQREGISAGAWLDRAAGRMNAPKAQGLVSGLLETIGRWEGAAEGHPEGVLVIGEHIWWESPTGEPMEGLEDAEEHRESTETLVPWDHFESATLSESELELKPIKPSMIFRVTLTDFDDAGPEPWEKLVEQNGIRLERRGLPPSMEERL